MDYTFHEKIWGRGLLQIRQTVEEEIRNLSEYVNSSTEGALIEVITEGLLTVEDNKKEYKRKEMRNSQERWQKRGVAWPISQRHRWENRL